MIINTKTIEVGRIEPGDTFRYSDDLYMVVNPPRYYVPNIPSVTNGESFLPVVRLSDGAMEDFNTRLEVEQVKITATVQEVK